MYHGGYKGFHQEPPGTPLALLTSRLVILREAVSFSGRKRSMVQAVKTSEVQNDEEHGKPDSVVSDNSSPGCLSTMQNDSSTGAG